jgi:hypothetical protein
MAHFWPFQIRGSARLESAALNTVNAVNTVNTVQLPLRGWLEQHRAPNLRVWANQKRQLRLLEVFPGVAGLPAIQVRSLESYRRAERQLALEQGSGIIEVSLARVAGLDALRIVTKRLADPEIGVGFEYVGQFKIQLNDAFLTITTRASPWGEAVSREELIEARLAGREGRLRFDPYEPRFDQVALNHVGDQARFDAWFPQHPLTLVRRDLGRLARSVQRVRRKEWL